MQPEDVETNCDPSRRRRWSSRGQGMVEYALILVLVAVVVIVALKTLGGSTSNVYSNITNSLGQ